MSDDVWVVAPETDQSGVAHSLSLSDPLRLRADRPSAASPCSGTPTDCVIMGVQHILKDKRPDLVLSGVNRGQNVAEDVTYSGTVAGAMEGTLLGIPSIALSQAYGIGGQARRAQTGPAPRRTAPAIIRKLLAHGFAKGMLVNVNFPDCEPDEVAGTRGDHAGPARPGALMGSSSAQDGRGNPYYWIAFLRAQADAGSTAPICGRWPRSASRSRR